MANTFVPFNFNPVATAVYTNSDHYTVPANKFAYIEIFANTTNSQGTVSLNSDVFFKSTYIYSAEASRATIGTSTVNIPSDCLAYVFAKDDTGGLNASPLGITSVQSNFCWNGQVSVDTAAPNIIGIIAAGLRNEYQKSANGIWIKAGDQIDISASGDIRVVVMEYDVPS
jgi:hypothetical protein